MAPDLAARSSSRLSASGDGRAGRGRPPALVMTARNPITVTYSYIESVRRRVGYRKVRRITYRHE